MQGALEEIILRGDPNGKNGEGGEGVASCQSEENVYGSSKAGRNEASSRKGTSSGTAGGRAWGSE